MPGKTKKVTISKKSITITRPTFREYRDVATKIWVLLQLGAPKMFEEPEFLEVLQASTTMTIEEFGEWLDAADYQDPVALWDEVLKHGEFQDFFAKRQVADHAWKLEGVKLDFREQAESIRILKEEGQLPANFSLEDEMRQAMRDGVTQNQTLSPSTISPAGTDGPDQTWTEKITGMSPETIQKQSEEEKP